MANVLSTVKGTSGKFVEEATGKLVALYERDGFYQSEDGRKLPNSYIAVLDCGERVNWPAWLDDEGVKHPWNWFDAAIDLTTDVVHIYRTENRRFRVELA